MANVKRADASSVDLTVTNLHSIATSSTWVSGWTSGTIDDTTNLYLDYVLSAKITVAAAGLAAGEIRVSIYTMLDDANWLDVFSAGTAGTEGTATIHDTEIRDGAFRLLWGQVTDTTASRVYSMPQISVLRALGFVPHKFALFIAHSTGANLAASGNQVTYKGKYKTVA